MGSQVWCLFGLAFSVSVALGGVRAGQTRSLNAFEVVAMFPELKAISDSNDDGVFECVTATRTKLNLHAKKATYELDFKGHRGTSKKHTTFDLTAGPTPDSFVYTTDEDPDYHENVVIKYSNFKDCVILSGSYYVPRCVLYVTDDVADKVPSECLQHFQHMCDAAAPEDISDLCTDE
ncbi:uncharacterized protein LOC144167452 [Haemaphysalis longicornis]